jgi:hypothetical protein
LKKKTKKESKLLDKADKSSYIECNGTFALATGSFLALGAGADFFFAGFSTDSLDSLRFLVTFASCWLLYEFFFNEHESQCWFAEKGTQILDLTHAK